MQLYNKCGVFEHTHSRPRPEQFSHKRGPLVSSTRASRSPQPTYAPPPPNPSPNPPPPPVGSCFAGARIIGTTATSKWEHLARVPRNSGGACEWRQCEWGGASAAERVAERKRCTEG
ncbi:hypothetical protein FB451DRAFT_1288983 [Mycena latifolia]|nr:hypothetical protein FB451DRAFT_1331883 [Mycena latifolia]KAJ7440719.1 hypothetical protein FB451DRAFT_1299586 [Mycena latifolia]KAJ7448313.1 hypothetical protein FB451DRAFT_1288983 [Mycena latifolia]